ncbi:unnamed protein product [Camellia sinensis]
MGSLVRSQKCLFCLPQSIEPSSGLRFSPSGHIWWQLPNIDSSVLASTANELRRDKYTPVNPEKLKAAAVGLSQSR